MSHPPTLGTNMTTVGMYGLKQTSYKKDLSSLVSILKVNLNTRIYILITVSDFFTRRKTVQKFVLQHNSIQNEIGIKYSDVTVVEHVTELV